ncbi:MAG TPA: inositol monophosphatase family protein, partial [Solirubrobacteraceae bacterium]|nr:inositol monophosphatase family protein [Solirubrobacteraceae bacterium]
DLDVERKADDSPVTLADREIERALRARIAERHPEDGILGEEHGREGLDRERVWVVDPIDGTKSFITGSPLFGTLVALTEAGRPTVGVIDVPVLGERLGGDGRTAALDGAPLRTRACTSLADAVVCTAPPEAFPGRFAPASAALDGAGALRRWGGDCYMYVQLALGCVDAVVEAILEPDDFAALVPVVQGAGGVMPDWSGAPLTISSAGDVAAAATPELHRQLLARLAGAG